MITQLKQFNHNKKMPFYPRHESHRVPAGSRVQTDQSLTAGRKWPPILQRSQESTALGLFLRHHFPSPTVLFGGAEIKKKKNFLSVATQNILTHDSDTKAKHLLDLLW